VQIFAISVQIFVAFFASSAQFFGENFRNISFRTHSITSHSPGSANKPSGRGHSNLTSELEAPPSAGSSESPSCSTVGLLVLAGWLRLLGAPDDCCSWEAATAALCCEEERSAWLLLEADWPPVELAACCCCCCVC